MDMLDRYRSLLGHADGARKIHVHLTTIENTGTPRVYGHRHAAEEAVFVLEGEVEFAIDGRRARAGPGEMLFFPSGTHHESAALGGPRVRYLVIRSVEPDAEERCCCGEDAPPAGA
jgi:uncharacterized cupin superfamily protein